MVLEHELTRVLPVVRDLSGVVVAHHIVTHAGPRALLLCESALRGRHEPVHLPVVDVAHRVRQRMRSPAIRDARVMVRRDALARPRIGRADRRDAVDHWDPVGPWKGAEIMVERMVLLHDHDDVPNLVEPRRGWCRGFLGHRGHRGPSRQHDRRHRHDAGHREPERVEAHGHRGAALGRKPTSPRRFDDPDAPTGRSSRPCQADQTRQTSAGREQHRHDVSGSSRATVTPSRRPRSTEPAPSRTGKKRDRNPAGPTDRAQMSCAHHTQPSSPRERLSYRRLRCGGSIDPPRSCQATGRGRARVDRRAIVRSLGASTMGESGVTILFSQGRSRESDDSIQTFSGRARFPRRRGRLTVARPEARRRPASRSLPFDITERDTR